MDTAAVPIGVVERETGLTRDALRKWELRYGFPAPERDDRGERLYSWLQIDRLRLIKRMLDRGLRPSKLVGLDQAALRCLADDHCEPVTGGHEIADPFGAAVFRALDDFDPEALRRVLLRELLCDGLARFVQVKLVNVQEMVRTAWSDGRLAVFQEHLYSETVQTVLRQAIADLPVSGQGPGILLATPTGELHTFGLLIAQAHLALAGARCVFLGSQLPLAELVRAATAYRVQVVGLSFSLAYPSRGIGPLLAELRRKLDPSLGLWVGGRGGTRLRALPAGILAVGTLAEATAALEAWSPVAGAPAAPV